jgi:hypothetical protein
MALLANLGFSDTRGHVKIIVFIVIKFSEDNEICVAKKSLIWKLSSQVKFHFGEIIMIQFDSREIFRLNVQHVLVQINRLNSLVVKQNAIWLLKKCRRCVHWRERAWIEGQLLLHPLRLRMISTQPKILTSSERLSFKLQSKECALIQISAKGSLYQILRMHLVFLHLSEKKSRQTQLQVVLQRPFLRPERNSNFAFRAKKN